MSVFDVKLKRVIDDSYDIEIGYSLKQKLIDDLSKGMVENINRYVVISDSNVKKLYAEKIFNMLQEYGYSADLICFPAGEVYKTRQTKEFIEDKMIELGCRRDCCIIAVGGGVVTDLAGFVAGTFGRGIPYINYATTLLAAADASIGGKTAVDTLVATNLIGLINQPRKVYIDIETWSTLPMRQISSGLAETIKHACIANRDFFDYLMNNMEKIFSGNEEVCSLVALENCKVKYEVVMKDERECGLREILNLGHTVGRALEAVSDYRLLHGEALAIGLMAEVKLAVKLGYCSLRDEELMQSILEKAELPTCIPKYIDKGQLIKKLYTDKKVKNGELRFVLQKGIGDIMTFGDNEYARIVDEDLAREIILTM